MSWMHEVTIRDNTRWEVAPIDRSNSATRLSGRLQPKSREGFLINSIGIVLLASPSALLPLSHPLWIASIFSLLIGPNKTAIYEAPSWYFADPIYRFAQTQTPPERNSDSFGYRLKYPYCLDSQLATIEAVLTHRLTWDEARQLPESAEILVVLNGEEQRQLRPLS